MSNTKTAVITGATGQDGSYLAEFLLAQDYMVYGLVRRVSTLERTRIEHLFMPEDSPYRDRLVLLYGDLCDASSLNRLLERAQPDEIYNLGAQSHVGISFEIPEYTADVNALGTVRLLDAVLRSGLRTKFYQASSSEVFGQVMDMPQRETTTFNPKSPYACAKAYAFWMTKNYREAYGMFACNGILFNHESPRRAQNFVTRKITLGLTGIKLGLQDKVVLGNLDARRDWGYAPDYVEAMWQMLHQAAPDDYVIATGESHSVRDFVEASASELGMRIEWIGSGLDEKGIDADKGRVLVEVQARYFRPSEVDQLVGDSGKAQERFGWDPQKTGFKQLVSLMVRHDLAFTDRKAWLHRIDW